MTGSIVPEDVVEVHDDPDRQRYVVTVDGDERGIIQYRRRGDTWVLVHTEIEDAFTGRGLASTLVRAALEDVRGRGGLIVPLCPYVSAWLDRHPAHRDLVDDELATHYRRN